MIAITISSSIKASALFRLDTGDLSWWCVTNGKLMTRQNLITAATFYDFANACSGVSQERRPFELHRVLHSYERPLLVRQV